MKPADYETLIHSYAQEPLEVRVQAYGTIAANYLTGPLSAWEKSIADGLIAKAVAARPTWYHGGLKGREVGDVILPRGATGADPRPSGRITYGPDDRVYFSTHLRMARGLVKMNEDHGNESVVYEIEPLGEIEIDPEGLRSGLLMRLDRPNGPA